MSKHLMQDRHFTLIEEADNYHCLRGVAEEIILLMTAPVGMVCGPISTGGLGSIEANIARFNEAISTLENLGHNIFNQMPFEKAIERIHVPGEDGYDWNILYDFYEPIFESGKVGRKFFIPGWQSSTGAVWEREQAVQRKIEIIDLSEDLIPIL